MEKIDLTLPLPLYRGMVAVGMHAGKMIEGSVHFTYFNERMYMAISTDWGVFIKIRPETLGMYIGKDDINGKKIFTGDVLKYESKIDGETDIEYLIPYWERSSSGLMLHSSQSNYPIDIADDISELEIIGNIHENPELLKLFPHLQG